MIRRLRLLRPDLSATAPPRVTHARPPRIPSGAPAARSGAAGANRSLRHQANLPFSVAHRPPRVKWPRAGKVQEDRLLHLWGRSVIPMSRFGDEVLGVGAQPWVQNVESEPHLKIPALIIV